MRPRVTIYNQISVDGRIGGFSTDPALYYRLGFRWPVDAILMGSVTAAAFGPEEQADEQAGAGPVVDPMPIVAGFEALVTEPRPLLVVVDSAGARHNWRHARAQPWYAGYVSLVSARTPRAHLDHLGRRGVAVIEAGEDRVDLPAALALLRERYGIERVRTDAGGSLAGALLAARCVDEIITLVVPTISGDPGAPPLVSLPGPLGEPGIVLSLDEVESLEAGHVLLRYSVERRD